ncbi:sensor histidine kinase [Kitasatospora sp. NPDC051853]|uniref:sensor histidine kinase n=1 Tax=Kitasatospora sp. NPDC051853 TaxID=3364058 RepID=UPI00379FD4F1
MTRTVPAPGARSSVARSLVARSLVARLLAARPLAAWSLAAVTVVAVPAGTARAGGRLDLAGTVPLALWLGLLLLAGRQRPLLVLLLSLQAVLVFRTSGLTELGWVWPASAAYAVLAADDRPGRPGLPWAVGLGAAQLAFAVGWETTAGGVGARAAIGSLGVEALWLALLLAAAAAHRNRLRWRSELEQRVLRAEQEREAQAGRRIAEARLEMARELHDVVGHTLTVVGLQLRVATEALGDSPEDARAALATAQQVRTEAVRDLRSLVDVLRTPGRTPVEPAAGAAEVAALVERTRSARLDVRLETTGDLAALPAPASLAVHRVVQEALTNTVRHAGASRAEVSVRCADGQVEVTVLDDGVASAVSAAASDGGSPSSGHGIRGMGERVAALGGEFAAGPRGAGQGGGWLVRAVIPVPGFRA